MDAMTATLVGDDLTASAVQMLKLLPGPPAPGQPGANVGDLAFDLFGADRPDLRKRVRGLRQELLKAGWGVEVVRCCNMPSPLRATYFLTAEALHRAHNLFDGMEY